MKQHLTDLVAAAIARLQQEGTLPPELPAGIKIERTRDPRHGDFACNAAMVFAKPARRKPRELAEALIGALAASEHVSRVEIAGPGFINFALSPAAFRAVVPAVLEAGEAYGRSAIGAGAPVQVEFVSANPTGPLHVGHGRGAAYGAAVADLLAAAGYSVHREYYVNDAGRQMDILAASVWLRYLELCGEAIRFPANGYKSETTSTTSRARCAGRTASCCAARAPRCSPQLPADEPEGGDKEAYIDAVVARARALLGEDLYRVVFDAGLEAILGDIREDLEEFGVVYEQWFSERSLTESGAVQRAIERLREHGRLYEKDGALWFRSSDFGDEKDRVVVRDNGQTTYFASDIAYHMDKLERGFERVIDVWGADHHGYVPRVKAALQALGDDASKLDVLLVQFAILYRGGQKVQMSTRSGSFVTLRELRDGGRQRRRALLLCHAQGRAAPGLRPGPGQVAEQRQPGLLHPVRPRARVQRDAPARGEGPGLRPGARRGQSRSAHRGARAGAVQSPLALSRGGRGRGAHL